MAQARTRQVSKGESGVNAEKPVRAEKSRHRQRRRAGGKYRPENRYAALDLGTNNCRLLIAAPRGKTYRVVDAFSRIVRLGEGVSHSGVLSKEAMLRTINALQECAAKIKRRGVTHLRCIATQACRGAANGTEFLDRVSEETGLSFEIISTEEEARLAVAGCVDLLDPQSPAGLVFDIGGGSTEISWIRRNEHDGVAGIAAWTSLPFGVVSLSEKWGGREITANAYEEITANVRKVIADLGDPAGLKATFEKDAAHLLGTSGTVTSIAGVHLGLPRYRRDRVDGLWLSSNEVRIVSQSLCEMSFEERSAEPCIGEERADLVVCGCAILEGLQQEWPSTRIRVADRGLREGILDGLARKARDERKAKRRKSSR